MAGKICPVLDFMYTKINLDFLHTSVKGRQLAPFITQWNNKLPKTSCSNPKVIVLPWSFWLDLSRLRSVMLPRWKYNSLLHRRVHAWRGIMDNRGKISRKQGSKMYFYCNRRNPFPVFTSVSESIELGISLLIRVTEMLFLWLERLRLDQIIWF